MKFPENRYLTVAVIAMIVLMVLLWNVRISVAHEHNHPELNDWFKSLHSKDGAWCCDGDDANLADWDIVGDHYRVKIGDQWVTVPDGAIVIGENKAGGARVWPYYTDGRPNVRCFLPGDLT